MEIQDNINIEGPPDGRDAVGQMLLRVRKTLGRASKTFDANEDVILADKSNRDLLFEDLNKSYDKIGRPRLSRRDFDIAVVGKPEAEEQVVQPPVQVPTLLQPAQPTQAPSLTAVTGQQAVTPMAPEPQFQPFQFQSQKEIEQAAKSPVFLANPQAIEAQRGNIIMPTKEAEQAFGEMTPEQQQAAIQGGSGGVLSREASEKKKTLRQKISESINSVKSYGADLVKSAKRGLAQGDAIQTAKLTDLATGNVEGIDFDAMAKANKVVRDMGATDTELDFAQSDGIWDDISDWMKMVLPVAIESTATLASSGLEEIGTGAATGAAIGSVVPGAGTMAGAATGAMGGVSTAGYNMELYASILDGLDEKGVDVTNPTALKKAFSDKELMRPILKRANTRAGIIGVVDLVGGEMIGHTGRMLKNAEKAGKMSKGMGRLIRGVERTRGLDEAFTGSAGELAAQVGSGQEVNWQDVGLEGAGGAPMVALQGALSKGSQPAQTPQQPPTSLGGIPTQPVPPNAPFEAETPEVTVTEEPVTPLASTENANPTKEGSGVVEGAVKSKVTASNLNNSLSNFKLEDAGEKNEAEDSVSPLKVFNIKKDNVVIGFLSLKKDNDGNWRINFIDVKKSERRKGHAENLYKELNNALQKNNQGPLYSDKTLLESEDNEGVIPPQLLWEKLVGQGLAEKLENGTYRFKPTVDDTTEFVTVTDDELNAFRQGQVDPERLAAVQEDADAVRNGELTLEAIEDPNYRIMVQMQLEANKPVQTPVTTTGLQTANEVVKPEPIKLQVMGREVNMYNDYIPAKAEDVEPDAVYSFNADSKDGIPPLLRNKAYANPREVNGVKSENWHASISGDDLLKLYTSQQTNDNTNAGTSVPLVDEGVGQRTGSEDVVTDAEVVFTPTGSGTGEVLTEQSAAVPLPQVEPAEPAQQTDAEIESRMAEIEGNPDNQKEFNALENEMEKREKASVFDVPLADVGKSVDALLQKEKDKPNGYGAFIEKRDARETKEVADRYLNADKLTEKELIKDFSDAVRGNPTTWYADGLKLRESLKEATKRGIDTEKMLADVVSVYTNAGYSEAEAKSVVGNMLAPIFNKNVVTNQPTNASPTPLLSSPADVSTPTDLQTQKTIVAGNRVAANMEGEQGETSIELRNEEGKEGAVFYQGIPKTNTAMQVLLDENGNTLVEGSLNDVKRFKEENGITDDKVNFVDLDTSNPESLLNKFTNNRFSTAKKQVGGQSKSLPAATTTEPTPSDSPFTAFRPKGGETGRIAREALKKEVGPEAYKQMQALHKNAEAVIRGMEGQFQIDCP